MTKKEMIEAGHDPVQRNNWAITSVVHTPACMFVFVFLFVFALLFEFVFAFVFAFVIAFVFAFVYAFVFALTQLTRCQSPSCFSDKFPSSSLSRSRRSISAHSQKEQFGPEIHQIICYSVSKYPNKRTNRP